MLTRRAFLGGAVAGGLSSLAWSKARAIKVGVCTRDVAGAVKYGFDYIEPAAAEIAAMNEDEFRVFSENVLASPIRCYAFNSFIRRPELRVVGPDVPTSALKDYLEMCLPRCKRLGASVVVWGSAGSRKVPEGFSRERANDQIATFLKMAGDIARQSNIVIAIEPLRRQESNILNTGSEALEMVRKMKHSNVKMIIDYYHLREENEDLHILEKAKHEIVHLHFANPQGRRWPNVLGEDDHYAAFFQYLKRTGYSGGISIEGQGSFEKDGASSRKFFREVLL